MVEPGGSEQFRPVDAWGDHVHPAQPRHGALPGGVTGGNNWRGLLFTVVAVLVVLVAAPASLLGGFVGARIASRIPTTPLRIFIVTFGVAVAIYLFFRI